MTEHTTNQPKAEPEHQPDSDIPTGSSENHSDDQDVLAQVEAVLQGMPARSWDATSTTEGSRTTELTHLTPEELALWSDAERNITDRHTEVMAVIDVLLQRYITLREAENMLPDSEKTVSPAQMGKILKAYSAVSLVTFVRIGTLFPSICLSFSNCVRF